MKHALDAGVRRRCYFNLNHLTFTNCPLFYSIKGIFFRHQRKEDDYNLRPRWREALETKIAIDDGDTQGTVGQLVGWKLFEQHIAEGTYVDFEKR